MSSKPCQSGPQGKCVCPLAGNPRKCQREHTSQLSKEISGCTQTPTPHTTTKQGYETATHRHLDKQEATLARGVLGVSKRGTEA